MVLTLMLIAALLVGCVGGSQPGPTALPLRPTATADFSTDELQQGLDDIVAAGVPGAVIEVRVGDRVWSSGAGVASLRSELPARPEQTFRVASLTKPMLAAMVLQLVDEGKLSLDDPFNDYFPRLLADAPEPVTIRHLLQHTSGLDDYIAQLGLENPERIPEILATPHDPEDLLELATKQGWRSTPGTEYYYSNANYIALSMLVEKLDDQPLAESLRTRITEPLGLNSTRIPEGTELSDDHLNGYFTEQGFSIEVTRQDASLWSGAGGVESNVSDINTFMRALMSGAVVPPELLAEMTELSGDGYGLGLQGRADSCPDRAPVYLPLEISDAGGEQSPQPTSMPQGESTPTAAAAQLGGANTPAPTEGDEVQIGEAGVVYGHLGSGLGYRALTLTSPDGARQVTIAWNGSPANYGDDPRLDIVYELADKALSVDC